MTFSLYLLLGRVRSRTNKSLIFEQEYVQNILLQANRADSNLALLGDKHIIFSHTKDAMIMYAIQGSSYVAMGDPIGSKESARDLIWNFYETACYEGLRTVFYRIHNDYLPFYLETKLTIFKLGEEAIVECATFTLDGSSKRSLRYTYNKIVRDGYTFTVIPSHEVSSHFNDLTTISQAWLSHKKAREKTFSLGRFDPDYISQFRCALIHHNGQLIAFANLWESGKNHEISPDLMRYYPHAPHGIMDFLFVELILWAKKNGFSRCNLGMAPLSGFEKRAAAPLWNRFASFIFHRGSYFYNFNGLRQFKAKFATSWEPAYIAISKGFKLPVTLLDIATLIGAGKRGILTK